jgi:release factor glutamine methyltransferase
MFVQTNSIKAVKSYFQDRLKGKFSVNEIKLIGNDVFCSRLDLSGTDLIGIDEQLLSESDLLYFRSVVKRLLLDEPFQYVVGNAHFYGLILKCDQRALIPRPETEELVDWVKDTFIGKKNTLIVDLCTGSGCIGLALKSVFPDAHVFLTDYSEEALELAKENVHLTGLNVEFKQFDATLPADYQKSFDGFEGKMDCWISNPPYIPVDEKSLMDENVINFEPHMALFVPNNEACVFYSSIAEMALLYLKPGGFLFFEIHENYAENVKLILTEFGYREVIVRRDLQNKERMVRAIKG